MEAKRYVKALVMTDRMDYLSPMTNNMCYIMAVEKLMGIEITPRAQTIRLILAELSRLASHLVWLGTSALDIAAMSVFLKRNSYVQTPEITPVFQRIVSWLDFQGSL